MSLKINLPGFPGIEKEAGRSAYGRIRYRRSNFPAVQRGGVIRITLGWVYYRSILYPHSSVGNTYFTAVAYKLHPYKYVQRTWIVEKKKIVTHSQ